MTCQNARMDEKQIKRIMRKEAGWWLHEKGKND